MVRARLHIICGNCGCNDMFSYEINKELNDDLDDGSFIESVSIYCGNCSTIHSIDEAMKTKTNVT